MVLVVVVTWFFGCSLVCLMPMVSCISLSVLMCCVGLTLWVTVAWYSVRGVLHLFVAGLLVGCHCLVSASGWMCFAVAGLCFGVCLCCLCCLRLLICDLFVLVLL